MYYVFLMAHGMQLMAETFYTSVNITDIVMSMYNAERRTKQCFLDVCNVYLVSRSVHYTSGTRSG